MKDSLLIKIRPVLNLKVKNSSDLESFQNMTLRPILKLQHETTLAYLKHTTHFDKAIQKADRTNQSALSVFIKKYLSTNLELRHKIIGVITGMMTSVELEYYFKNTSEINKRIVSMQVKRFVDTLQKAN